METPAVGLGTLGLNESAVASVENAVDQGCDIVDTGEHYGNLALVGAGLKKCSRKPFTIVKLSGMPSGNYQEIRERVEKILNQLDIKRAELCLIHWPGLCSWDATDMAPLGSPADFQGRASSWNEFCEHIKPAWLNMKHLREDGLCAEIGTSNFYLEHLGELARQCDGAIPFANEIFVDATNQESEFVANMQTQGIRVLAYRPVAYKPFPPEVKAVAARFGENVSPQTVILAWLLKRGIWPLVKCRNDHINENFSMPLEIKDQFIEADLEQLKKAEAGIRFSQEWFAKLWKFHTSEKTVSEELVQQLVMMGVDEEKARTVLEKVGGDLDAALDIAFAE